METYSVYSALFFLLALFTQCNYFEMNIGVVLGLGLGKVRLFERSCACLCVGMCFYLSLVNTRECKG